MADTVKVKATKQGFAPLAPGQRSRLIECGTVFVVEADMCSSSWFAPLEKVAKKFAEPVVDAVPVPKPPVEEDAPEPKKKKKSKASRK